MYICVHICKCICQYVLSSCFVVCLSVQLSVCLSVSAFNPTLDCCCSLWLKFTYQWCVLYLNSLSYSLCLHCCLLSKDKPAKAVTSTTTSKQNVLGTPSHYKVQHHWLILATCYHKTMYLTDSSYVTLLQLAVFSMVWDKIYVLTHIYYLFYSCLP